MSLKASHDGLEPPIYEEVVTYRGANSDRQLRSRVQDDVHDELLNLALQVGSIQGQKFQELEVQDEQVLNLILPQVKSFLADYSTTALPMATLILIPSGVISPAAVACDEDLRSADDFGRIVRIATEKASDLELWKGIDMAERLAAYLRPREEKSIERISKPQSPPPEATPAKRQFWRKKSIPGKQPTDIPDDLSFDGKRADLPKVSMDVKAEEVVFRTQSPLGLYETQSVWGIVIRIHVNADGRSC